MQTSAVRTVCPFCKQAWQNERFAPELLEHKTEVVDCVLEQIKEMVRRLFTLRGSFTPLCRRRT